MARNKAPTEESAPEGAEVIPAAKAAPLEPTKLEPRAPEPAPAPPPALEPIKPGIQRISLAQARAHHGRA